MKIEFKNNQLFDRLYYKSNYRIIFRGNEFEDQGRINKISDLNYMELSELLNDNNVHFPSIEITIPVIFYNFSIWTRMKARVNFFIQEPSLKTFIGKLTTSYQAGTESIYISKNLYEHKGYGGGINEHRMFECLLNSGCSQEEATNLVLLHEIGHAIHHQLEKRDGYLLEPTTPQATFLNPFIRLNGDCVDGIDSVTRIAHKAITESYADLYSCILVDRLYDSSRSDLIINALHKYRTTHHEEGYYSYPSIETYLNDRNGRSFKNFRAIHTYMSATIADSAVYDIGKNLRSGEPQLSKFIGVVNRLHGLNHKKIDDAIESIRNEFIFTGYILKKIDKNNPYGYHQNIFEIGCKYGEEWMIERDLNIMQRKIRKFKITVEDEIESKYKWLRKIR